MNWFPLALFLSVTAVAMFSFVSIVVWSEARRQERENYYKTETAKKIAESQGAGASLALEYLRAEDEMAQRRLGRGLRLSGFVACAVGISLGVFFWVVVSQQGIFLLGLLPLLVGIALIAYSYIGVTKN